MPTYFVTSSFPAMFGHFISEDYILAGARFLISHMNDKLIHALVGTYLFHAFFFRDRLFQTFVDLLSASTEILSPSSLLVLLIKSVELCMPYLSASHVQVVVILCRIDRIAALKAVCELFLGKTVQLWSYAGFFAACPTFHSFLDALTAKLTEKAEETAPLLECFTSLIQVPVPAINGLVFGTGVHFAPTVVDSLLMRQMQIIGSTTLADQPPRCLEGDTANALRDAFVIRRTLTYHPRSVPELKEPAAEDERSRLLYAKRFHEYLYSVATGLDYLGSVRAAMKRVLELTYLRYADVILNPNGEAMPSEFRKSQLQRFATGAFESRFFSLLGGFIRENKINVAVELSADIEKLEQTKGIAPAIAEGIVAYANKLKAKQSRAPKQAPEEAIVEPWDVRCVAVFTAAVDRLAFGLTVPALSALRIEIARGSHAVVESWIEGSTEQDWIEPTREQWKFEMAASGDLTFFLGHLGRVFQYLHKKGQAPTGAGKRLLFFLQVDHIVTHMFPVATPGWQAAFLQAIISEQELLYLRAFLLQTIMALRSHQGVAIGEKAAAVEHLQQLFGLKSG
jgi:hypothetical protein